MIVVDASAFTELLTTRSEVADRIREAMARDSHWCSTEHFLIEVANALRRPFVRGELGEAAFERAWSALSEATIDVWPTKPLLPRIRELVPNATTYDAAYVALAEELGCALVTADAKLARIPGTRCQILGPGGAD